MVSPRGSSWQRCSGPKQGVVLSVGLAVLQGYQTTNTAILLAAANMATIPILVIFLFFQKQLIEGISLSGLK